MIEKQIDELEAGIQAAKLESDGGHFTVKQLEKTKKGLRRRLEKLEKKEKKDDVLICLINVSIWMKLPVEKALPLRRERQSVIA